MNIALAQEKEIPSILDINRSVNVTGVSSSLFGESKGFLIYRYDESTLAPLVKKGQVLIAQAEEGATVGYLVFQYWEDSEMAETRNQLKTVRHPTTNLFALPKLVWIYQLGVTFSAALHRKLGFSRIGSYEADDFYGVKNYRSGVYCKK